MYLLPEICLPPSTEHIVPLAYILGQLLPIRVTRGQSRLFDNGRSSTRDTEELSSVRASYSYMRVMITGKAPQRRMNCALQPFLYQQKFYPIFPILTRDDGHKLPNLPPNYTAHQTSTHNFNQRSRNFIFFAKSSADEAGIAF